MKAIHKFQIEIDDRTTVDIPGLQRIVSIAVQYDKLVLYAIVDLADEAKTSVPIIIKGIGHLFGNVAEECWVFMGTHITNGGSLVWHVWIPNVAFFGKDTPQ